MLAFQSLLALPRLATGRLGRDIARVQSISRSITAAAAIAIDETGVIARDGQL
jgi:hypothetical protein